MKSIAIIPARGGSKRIPRKNIRNFLGIPIISRTIEKLQATEIFCEIIVSTDDDEIKKISELAGAKVPFKRDFNLSDDQTPTVPVIKDALERLGNEGKDFDVCCCVYPCNPFILKKDLLGSLKQLITTKSSFCYPVTEYRHPTQRRLRQDASGKMHFLEPQNELTRTQDLEVLFHDTGQFYWGTTDAWKAGLKMHTDGIGYPIPNWRVVDIDNKSDWILAEQLFIVFEKMEDI